MPVTAEIQCELSNIELRTAIDNWATKNGLSVSFPNSVDTIQVHSLDDSQAKKLEELCKKNDIAATFKKI